MSGHGSTQRCYIITPHLVAPDPAPLGVGGGGVRGVQERPELISMRSLRSRSRAAGGSLGSCKSHSNSALRIWLAPGRRRRAIGPFMLAVCKEDRPPLPPPGLRGQLVPQQETER